MSRILPKLYLGNFRDASNMTLLKRNNISHILCSAGELNAVFPQNFVYKLIRASDHPGFNLGMYLDSAADFINNSLRSGTGVLVHCYMGISRSTSCVMAYLMKYQNMTMTSAFSLCKKNRSIVCPNPGFMNQLRKFSEKLRRTPIARELLQKKDSDIQDLFPEQSRSERMEMQEDAIDNDNLNSLISSLKSRNYNLHSNDSRDYMSG